MAITTVKLPRLVPIALALLAVTPHSQAGWRLTPTVGATETFTDNVALQPDDSARSAWVSEATPGFLLAGITPRLQLTASGQLHLFAYSGKRQPNTSSSLAEYNANGQARVVDDWLYLDAAAWRGTQAISAFGPDVAANLWAMGNRTPVSTWRLSPYLRHSFSNRANLTVRYSRDSVDAGRNLLGSSEGKSVAASLASGSHFDTLGWNLDYNRQELDNRLAGPSSSEMALAGLRLRVARSLSLTASTGYDRYDFQSLGGRTEGRNWAGGFIWAPTSRTNVQASWGHRYFGPSGSLAASHRTRRSVWSVHYSDAITTSRAQFLLPASIDTSSMLDKLFLTSFPDPVARQQAVQAYMQMSGLPTSLADSVNYFSNRYMRQKQFQAAVGLNGAHGSWMLTAFDTRRQALSVQQSDSELLGSQLSSLNNNTSQRGVSSLYNYRLSSRTTALFTATVARTESIDAGQVQDTRMLRFGMTHQLSSRMQGAFEVRHATGGTSALTSRTYTENAVSATLSMQL
jgi:uncharacterized protein (PEP-CTERM system associated)